MVKKVILVRNETAVAKELSELDERIAQHKKRSHKDVILSTEDLRADTREASKIEALSIMKALRDAQANQ